MIRLIFSIFIMTNMASAASLPRLSYFDDKGCLYNKDYKFLSKDDVKKLETNLGTKLYSKTVRKLKVKCKDQLSHAYILNDKVRTHYQTLLVWVNKKAIKSIQVLEFTEPKKYMAPKSWIETLNGLDSSTLLKVDALSGATLTRQSTLNLVKQALYLEN